MTKPRAVWMMVPAAVVDHVLDDLIAHLDPGDIIIDGGNSWYRDDIDRAKRLKDAGFHYVDCGTSGGIAGSDRGYCLMVGAEPEIFEHLTPIFKALAPGRRDGRAHARPHGRAVDRGAGLPALRPQRRRPLREDGAQRHRVRDDGRVRRGLQHPAHANVGKRDHAKDAETAPLRNPEHYQYDIDVPQVAEVWRRGSVVGSWLLDLTAKALVADPELSKFGGRVSDSGEGRWTIQAAIDEAVPAQVLSAALYERFSSQGQAKFANQILSAMRAEFGGHAEKKD